MSKTGTTEKPDPWRVPVAVAQIPETGLHRDIAADQAVRHGLAEMGGLREVLSAQASFDVTLPHPRRVSTPAPQSIVATGSAPSRIAMRSTADNRSSFSVLITAERASRGIAPPV